MQGVSNQISGADGKVLISASANNTLIYYAVDSLGNVETTNTLYALLDLTSPTVNAGSDKAAKVTFNTTNSTDRTPIASATDSESGIRNISWTANSSSVVFSSNNTLSTLINATVEGTYTIYLNVTDNVNQSTVKNFTFVWDTTLPTEPTVTLSKTGTIYTGDTLTFSCSGSTDNLGIVTYTKNSVSTSTAGSFSATCTATDDAGNSRSASEGYTVSNRQSTSSGGGASGLAPREVAQSVIYSLLAKGITQVAFSKGGLGVLSVDIDTKEATSDVSITATSLTALPTDVPAISGTAAPAKTYGYLKIDHTNLDNSKIGSAKIKFKVEKSKLSADGFNPEDVALYRYTIQWDKLTTAKVSEDATYYYFEAVSPGLSYFAIGTFKQAAVTPKPQATPPAETPAAEPAPAETPAVTTPTEKITAPVITPPEKTSGNLWLISIVILIVIAAGMFFWFSREKPSDENEGKEAHHRKKE